MSVPMPSRVLMVEAAIGAWVFAFLLVESWAGLALLLAAGAGGGVWAGRWTAGRDGRPFGAVRECAGWALGGLAVWVLLIPFVLRGSPYWLFVLVLAGVHALMAVGLNVQVGSTEMVNLGFAGFAAIGAYTSAVLSREVGWDPWLGTVAGAVVTCAVGVLVGLPAARTRGYYYSLVTIAFGIVVYLVLVNLTAVGGPSGLGRIPPLSVGNLSLRAPVSVAGLSLPAQATSFYLTAVVLAAAAWIAQRLHRSELGLVWNALREDEVATRCLGVDVTRAKLWAMGFGTFLGGLAGALYAHTVGFIAPDNFTFLHSVMLVSMVILGGADHVAGVVVGAVLLTVVPEKFRAFQDYRLLLYGAVLLGMLHVRPRGLLPKGTRSYPSVSGSHTVPRAGRRVESDTVAVR
ncbi:MAG: branched-chain amino acid ABC transporter permease [Armatimonadota bacterium]|nr:branched-chain amino acid ABC transporter permease [Armatimonadota bacterium]MDR5696403.1 branched-chain amino acid ABC transporter permease [Armatimonadota bacterium]